MKYILVSGGVISGIGKGVISSSIGTILKSYGHRVTAIKIDPYLNIDAGTFSPYEHGEVFVLDDGGEVDLDLGNYERFLNVKLHKDNNITTGKIYQHVISKERRGDYLGKTVQVVPHVTDAIMEWVERVAKIPVNGDSAEPEVCIIELGGTIGDIEGMPFVEAFRQFQFRVKPENFCNIHVSLLPQPSTTGEQKTKPTQHSVRALRGLGLSPDLICCRSQSPIEMSVKEKISNFCHVAPEQVITVHDVSSLYHVPMLLEKQNLSAYFNKRLGLTKRPKKSMLSQWQNLAEKYDRIQSSCNIALVGKYTRLEDSYASVIKALRHAALAINRKLVLTIIDSTELEEETLKEKPVVYHDAWKQLCLADGVLVPGGFGPRGVEGKVAAVKWARLNKKPYLGVCLGLQVAAIEFARTVLNMEDANSSELNPNTSHPVVIDMPEHNKGDMGGTMRLGQRRTVFQTEDSILRKLYNQPHNFVDERHRHRYEINPTYIHLYEEKGFMFVGHDVEGLRMEIMELKDHPYFVGVQFHPEFLSRPIQPSPPYLGLLLASCNKLESYIQRGNRLSPRERIYITDEESSENELEVFSQLTGDSNSLSSIESK
uniref:CTP synthase 1 n=1 Tax=Ciona intestinalis TaxID=7719 RepID=UPI0002B8E0F1|nr:CTP synthase 1 [Ciona intestinalis]|eukprot:XP_026692949.1 CTP synthase 1 [Ciona intestinalis]